MSLTLHTNYGDIKVELNCEDTPRTCPSPIHCQSVTTRLVPIPTPLSPSRAPPRSLTDPPVFCPPLESRP